MTVAEFSDPRLARLYDLVCLPRADITFYTTLAGATPLRVLDLCCGTGDLATALVERGHTVTGVDAATPMLAVARERPGGDRVTWIEGDARTVDIDGGFDLVVLSGHAFQAFLSDADVQALLRTARTALVPGGRLAFETRNPLVRAWERWLPASPHVELPEGGTMDVRTRLLSVHGAYVDFELIYRFSPAGDELVSRQVLRFPTREQVGDQLAAAGFAPESWLGDWDGTPYGERSPEIIVVAR